ncbi:MAG: molybdenum cofactor biosysynthesis protein [Rhodobacterales bacterium]|nr:MAG: molybdenum cofactor biosysynthesis protein [Rhodobacterales bacterium]
MTGTLQEIWRHPIKALGRERMASATLTKGRGIPGDRLWAVAHRRAKAKEPWLPCNNFIRAASSPALQAITAELTEDGTVHLHHPTRGDFIGNPDNPQDAERLIDWVHPLVAIGKPNPVAIYRAENAMTDSSTVSLSLINLASHRTIEKALDQKLSPLRWRGNLLVDGWEPWQEQSLVDKNIRIGSAEFWIRKEITRCRATEANIHTGERDAETLKALKSFGHMEMGIHAVVTKPGSIEPGDRVEIMT